jgi:hypothetical protein
MRRRVRVHRYLYKLHHRRRLRRRLNHVLLNLLVRLFAVRVRCYMFHLVCFILRMFDILLVGRRYIMQRVHHVE